MKTQPGNLEHAQQIKEQLIAEVGRLQIESGQTVDKKQKAAITAKREQVTVELREIKAWIYAHPEIDGDDAISLMGMHLGKARAAGNMLFRENEQLKGRIAELEIEVSALRSGQDVPKQKSILKISKPRPTCPVSGKKMFNKRLAQGAANRRMAMGCSPLRIYECPHCGYWHLSRIKKAN